MKGKFNGIIDSVIFSSLIYAMRVEGDTMNSNTFIIKDVDGKTIVVINDIRFKGKRTIKWDEVEEYLKEYVGECYEVLETSDRIFIGTDFPSEYKGSKDTERLKGPAAKAKANAVSGLPMLIKCANNKRFQDNHKEKHKKDAKYGWYRYTTRFALPVYDRTAKEIERYNVYRIEMLVRHAADNNLYLYDMVNIKKEMSTPL